jgi:hypothetical protein
MSSTLTKPRAKKPARSARRASTASQVKPIETQPLRNLPKGAIKLTERDFAAQALFADDMPE